MLDNVTLYLLLVVALAIGFALGRTERHNRRARGGGASDPPSFLQLVNEHQKLDIDAFVEAMVTHDDGVDMRLALGSLVRRRGEVEKAIRIHQGLLARPALTGAQRSRTELELARDYLAAGLLGRAETLLLELAQRDSGDRLMAQRGLLEIYQREREWRRAVDVGRGLLRHDRSMRTKLAHFQCELAETAMEQGDLRLAREELSRAGEFDPACARVSLTAAEVEMADERHREVRRLLERAVAQDADCVPLAVEPYWEACRAMKDEDAYVAFLERCLRLGPYLSVVEELAARLERIRGPGAAATFVMEQLLRNPTLGGFVALLEHLDRDGEPLGQEQLALVHRFSKSLLHRQPVYRCRNCGFPSHSLMWQCPSCHEWGTCKPIVRIEQAG